MNKRRILIWWVIVVLIAVYAVSEQNFRDLDTQSEKSASSYILPEKQLANVISFGFQNMWADILLLEAQVFYFDHRQSGKLEDGKRFKKMIELILALDPKYMVAANFANFALARSWDLMGVSDAIDIMKLAWKTNPDEHKIPTKIGFLFYEHQGHENYTRKWFNIALLYPDASKQLFWMIDSLSKDKTDNFKVRAEISCSLCKESEKGEAKEHYCKLCNLNTLLTYLNDQKVKYDKQFSTPLTKLDDLIRPGYIRMLPNCPFGGKFYITDKGKINSTYNIDKTSTTRRQ